jgi:L-aminopeptidase/D-esterase-like protein
MAASSLGMGFKVGHWTNEEAGTGCTVVLPPAGNVAAVDIRGSSPSERELTHLDPDRKMTEIHAVLLTGGSAFGLAAATGVMDWLAERDIGYQAGPVRVPIVPAAVIFDLGTGRSEIRPGPDGGRAACDDARESDIATGRVGAGTGATVGKWAGLDHSAPGGIGIATVGRAGETVSALAVVNAVGDVLAPDGTVLAGTSAPDPQYAGPGSSAQGPPNTVLALVATKATLDKREVRFLAARGADGITITVRPAHTRYDGDVVFGIAAPDESRVPNLDILGHMATEAVAEAVRAAVVAARN